MLRRDERTARRVLIAAAMLLAASVAIWVTYIALHSTVYYAQGDATVYRDAGTAVLHGRPLYPTRFGPAQLPFTYPPFAGLLMAMISPLPFAGWKAVLVAVDLVSLVVSAAAAFRLAGRPAADCLAPALAVAAVGLWLEPVDSTLFFGQLNLVLMALVLADLAFARGSRFAGAAIGLAAGIKLTPIIFIGYLLFSGRRRAATTAALVAAGTVVIGWAVLPSDAARYWGARLLQPGDGPQRLVNQSLRGALLRLTRHASGGEPLWLLVAIPVGALGLGAAVLAGRRGRELLGVCLCAATGLLVSPVSWSHHWVWVLALLVLAVSRPRAGWRDWASAALVVVLFAWWPLPVGATGGWPPGTAPHPAGLLRINPHEDGRELRWSVWQLLSGNYYVLAAALFVGGAAAIMTWSRPARLARYRAASAPPSRLISS